MEQQPHETSARTEDRPGTRKPYRKPELIEYGSVAKLTQSGGSRGQDAISGTKSMNCL
jgi:hypothetical protein